MMKKPGLFLLLILVFVKINAQENKIVKLLNEALQYDLQLKSRRFDDKIIVIQPYTVQNGILSVEFEIKNESEHYRVKNEVKINKIKAVVKDINVLLITEKDAVATNIIQLVPVHDVEKESKSYTYQIFTGIRNEVDNLRFAKKLQKAFKRAGIPINIDYWYD